MSYDALFELGRHRLDALADIGFGAGFWSVQRQIGEALSRPRAKVAVPSCNASGKSYSAAAFALAFYTAFQPGQPCHLCEGPCGGSKVITTSSKEQQLRDALWGEIRRHFARSRVPIPGRMLPGDLRLTDGPEHFLIGNSAKDPEGLQGIHASHKLIVDVEATSVSDEVASGITGLLASGDSRILLIFNPTVDDTWAAAQCRSGAYEVIKIRAWDTPHLSNFSAEEIQARWGVTPENHVPHFETAPPGSNLTNPTAIDEMVKQGMGKGSLEFTNRIEADFWSAAETTLILPTWVERARQHNEIRAGRTVFGVDIAPYGDAENVIQVRRGNEHIAQISRPSMRPDLFWDAVVRPAVLEYKPDLVVFDADGVGAGSIGDAEKACGAHRIIPFRGATSVELSYLNIRSMWWWRLRQRFDWGDIRVLDDPKLKEQLTSIRYDITEKGAIRVESKERMRKRGVQSPDRADALMYAFSIDVPEPRREPPPAGSEAAVWERLEKRTQRRKAPYNPFTSSRLW